MSRAPEEGGGVHVSVHDCYHVDNSVALLRLGEFL